jgi:hypothetical protein
MNCPVNVSLVSNIYGTVQIAFLRVCLQSKTSILYGSPLCLLLLDYLIIQPSEMSMAV